MTSQEIATALVVQETTKHNFMELNNWLQANGGTSPLSWATSRAGAHHDPIWNARIFMNGVLYGEGEAATKKGAKEVAAERALTRLKQEAAGA